MLQRLRYAQFLTATLAAFISLASVRVSAAQIRNVGSSAPVLAVSVTDLPSLASARKEADKCEVLLRWIESGLVTRRPVHSSYLPVSELLRIFRDQPMMAVFGRTYASSDDKWRREQFGKVMAGCLGVPKPSRNPKASDYRIPSASVRPYVDKLSYYQHLLGGAFLSTPGSFEPAAILRYLDEVKAQVAFANQTLAAAATTPTSRTGFDQLTSQAQSTSRRMTLLNADEIAQVATYLANRKAGMAPVLAEAWLDDARRSPQTIAAARSLLVARTSMSPVVEALDASAKAAWQRNADAILAALVAAPLQAEGVRLRGIPSSLDGIRQLAAWRQQFDRTFADVRGIPEVGAMAAEYDSVRARVLEGALPTWRQQVDALPLDPPALAGKYAEFEELFSRADRTIPMVRQYEAAVRAREGELRVRLADAQRKQDGLTADSFSARGLTNEKTLLALFRGDFSEIAYDRNSPHFGVLLENFLYAYGKACAVPPENNVELTYDECIKERVVTNGFGVEVSRSCVEERTVRTGLYAKPEMYAAKQALKQLTSPTDPLRFAGQLLSQPNPVTAPIALVGTMVQIRNDIQAVFGQNACGAPGMTRFEDNLSRYATGVRAVRLDGDAPSAVTTPIAGLPFPSQDYIKLVDDLIREESRNWLINGYRRGGVTNAEVTTSDGAGRPAKLRAQYGFEGFNGPANGTVTIDFSEGLPACMYFFDAPGVCRPPDRRIVAEFERGTYQR